MPEINKYISKASECNLTQFMSCAFDNDFTVLIISGKPSPKQLAEAFENIITEYYDISGIDKDMEEIEILRRLKYLELRNQAVSAAIFAQRQAVLSPEIGEPFTEYFSIFSNNGYAPKWTGDKQAFLKQLDSFERSEASYHKEYEEVKKELEDYYKSEAAKNKPMNSRKNFIRMVNNIERLGNRIDFNNISLERFAVMVSDYRELMDKKAFENSKN